MRKKNTNSLLTTNHLQPTANILGFTLLELLVVIAVIGTLATVLIVAINPIEIGRRSRDSKRLSDMGTLKSAIDLALSDGQNLTDTTDWVNLTVATPVSDLDGSGLDISKYLSVVSQNPGGNTQYVKDDCTSTAAVASDMAYQYKSDGDAYVIRARLESTSNCDRIKYDGNAANGYYHLGTDPGLDL